MASNRHLGRIIALQTLYEYEFRQAAGDTKLRLPAILKRNIARYQKTVEDTPFIERVVQGVIKNQDELDAYLQPIAPDWPISQIARIDRLILRIGLFELKYEPETPPKVVINEAVELAKGFGGENSSKFVNGVLGTAHRQLHGDTTESATDTPKKAPKPTKESE